MQLPSSSAESHAASPLPILFTCVGRRVELIETFRQAARRLGVALSVHGTDVGWMAPAMHVVDHGHLTPPIDSPQYIPTLLRLVSHHGIRLLVPTIDPDLPPLSNAADRFLAQGCRVLASPPAVIETCRDKLLTYAMLRDRGIDTPGTWMWAELLRNDAGAYPYYLKPRRGSAAQGNYVIRTREELEAFGRRVPEPIVQEFVEGVEHTVDVYCGLGGGPQCAVPRRRLEVRSGEVSKSLIVRQPAVMEAALRTAAALPGAIGVVTVQTMLTCDGGVKVIEINPRFGGGAPLSIRAGADFPRWILETLLGKPPVVDPNAFEDDLAMLRYDQSVFVSNASAQFGLRAT